jgi:hypothetical protein
MEKPEQPFHPDPSHPAGRSLLDPGLIVEGRPDNIKITRPEDLALAEFYLAQQHNQGRNP